ARWIRCKPRASRVEDGDRLTDNRWCGYRDPKNQELQTTTSVNAFIAVLAVQRFAPFVVRLPDQRSYHIRHPAYASIATVGDNLVVYDADGLHILNTRLVTEIHFPPRAALALAT